MRRLSRWDVFGWLLARVHGACGYTFCAVGQLCVERYENGWGCVDLPERCHGQPDCDCMPGEGGEAGTGGDAGWAALIADARCRECADDGPGLKVSCSAF